MEFEECGECNLKFHSIGTLSAGKRVKHHKRIKHKFECKNCGYKFVSTTHIAIHKFLSHYIECSKCEKVCEGHCLEAVTNEIEKAGEEEMKNAHKNIKNMIKTSEKVIMGYFSSANKRQIDILAECAWFIDIGNTNCNSTNWGMLVYLPSTEIRMFGLTEFGKKYIHNYMYMSALEKLKKYLNRLNRIGILKHVDQYVEFCMSFCPENSLTELTPEQLHAGKYCLPECEVSHWFSDQWELAIRKQNCAVTDARQEVEPREQTKGNTKEKRKDNEVTTAPKIDDGSDSSNSGVREANENKNESEDRDNTVVTPAGNKASKSDLIKDTTENKYANSNVGKDTFEEKLELENAKGNAKDNNYDSNKFKTINKSNLRIISGFSVSIISITSSVNPITCSSPV